jgi:hypothetical protein
VSRLTTQDLDRILETELARPESGGNPDGDPRDIEDLDEALLELREWSDCRRITPGRSHRRNLGAKAVRTVKRLFGLAFRPVIHTVLETQARFNERVVVAVELLQAEHRGERDRLTREIRSLREELTRVRSPKSGEDRP